MKRVYKYQVKRKNTTKNFLLEKGYSKHLISFLKTQSNSILVNKQNQNTNYLLKEEDILEITITEQLDRTHLKRVEQSLQIIYEDQDILIVNKPAKILVHPSRFNETTSLSDIIYSNDEDINPHYITRLDKDTSGLVLIAKNRYVCELLEKQQIDKYYLAIAQGKVETQLIDAPITKTSTIKRTVDKNGQKALTNLYLLKYYPKNDISLIKLQLLTGRTHQIRVHCSFIGHPLIGDSLYGNPSNKIDRQALHCFHLTFTHPITNNKLSFEIELPDDMNKLLEDV